MKKKEEGKPKNGRIWWHELWWKGIVYENEKGKLKRKCFAVASLSLTRRNKTPIVDGDVYQSHCFRIVRIGIISGDSTKWHSHFRPLMLKDARQTHDERKKAINRFVEMRTHWKHERFDPLFEAVPVSAECVLCVPSNERCTVHTLCTSLSTTTIAALNGMRPRSLHGKLWMAMAWRQSGAQESHKIDKYIQRERTVRCH